MWSGLGRGQEETFSILINILNMILLNEWIIKWIKLVESFLHGWRSNDRQWSLKYKTNRHVVDFKMHFAWLWIQGRAY